MTIAQQTPLLLLDEPTSALDLGHQIEVFELVRDLACQGRTVVMVLHDVNMAARFADEILALTAGRIAARGRPAEILTPDVLGRIYGLPMGTFPHAHMRNLTAVFNTPPSICSADAGTARTGQAGARVWAEIP